MLDVYIDEENIRKLSTLIRKDTLTDFASASYGFLKRKCNLYINNAIVAQGKRPPKYLSIFTQGRGENAKYGTFEKEESLLKTSKPQSVFFLESEDEIYKSLDKRFACSQGDDTHLMSKLLFLEDKQRKRFVLDKTQSDAIHFSGWKDLEANNLLPLTDIVIIDQYFLKPAASYTDYEAFIEESFMPLVKVLADKTLGNTLNISVYSSNKVSENRIDGEECFELINDFLNDLELEIKVNISLILPKNYKWHERYLYMNYMGVDTKLSLHGFKYDVLVGKDDRLNIFPYADDIETHEADLAILEKLSKTLRRKDTLVLGNGKNRLLDLKIF